MIIVILLAVSIFVVMLFTFIKDKRELNHLELVNRMIFLGAEVLPKSKKEEYSVYFKDKLYMIKGDTLYLVEKDNYKIVDAYKLKRRK